MSIKTGSDFSGVGAFDQALNRLGIVQDKVFACDMDFYARQTYLLNYGTEKDIELGNTKEHKYYADLVQSFILGKRVSDKEDELLNEANEFAKKFSFYYPFNVYNRNISTDSLDFYVPTPPCQSFSLAGKRQGENSDKGVLFYNSHEFIQKNNPRYFIFENVKGLLSDDGGKTFQRWIDYLGGKTVNGNPVIFPHENSVPYHVYYQVMNAKHYGVPQNRERIFIIGIRDDADNEFSFPKPFHLVKRLKDVLESEVDKKYFLSDKMIAGFISKNERIGSDGSGFGLKPKEDDEISDCITSRYYKQSASDVYVKGFVNQDTQASQVFSEDGITPNICAGTHGYANGYVETKTPQVICFGRSETEKARRKEVFAKTGKDSGSFKGKELIVKDQDYYDTLLANPNPQKEGLIMIPANNSKGYDIAEEEEDSINFSNPNSETRRGRVGHGVAQTLDTACNQGVLVRPYQIGKSEQFQATSNIIGEVDQEAFCLRASQPNGVVTNQRIRRLTPLECFRLMDFNENFKWNVSDSQAYKQAGNSIVVNCLVEIISKLKL